VEEAIKKAAVLIEALPYIQQFSGRPVVIKFGGSAMEQTRVLDGVMKDVVFLAAVGIRPVVVHGGGPHISRAMHSEGLSPRFVHGHRVTDAETLRLVVRVLRDRVSADIMQRIEAHRGRAWSALDRGHSPLRARKKTLEFTDSDGVRQQADLGYVGEVVEVATEQMLAAAAEGFVIVVPPIGQDETGQLYNINADTAAAAVAVALKAEKVVFLSDVHGIMARPDDPDSLLSTVRESEVEALIRRGVITGGMLPKVAACVHAINGGVRKAHIIDGTLPHSLLLEIFTDRGVGTQIVKD